MAVETSDSLSGTWTQRAITNLANANNTDVNATGLSISVPAGTTLYIRYKNTSSTSANGGTVGSTGTHRINSGSVVGTFVASGSSTAPTITNFTPTSGPVGTSVTLTGTNFAANATVSFNGTTSTNPTFTNNTSLTATVPAGATSGPIRVTVGSEFGSSSSNFTVIPPTITTNGTLTPFSTTSGAASTAQSFTVNGTNLTANITATAPASFEVSTVNATSGFATTATITQSGGNASGTVFVRLAASAAAGTPSGNITLSSTGATNRLVAVSGNVTAPVSGVPVVTGASFNGTVGVAFSQNVTATNGPNTFSSSPALPAELTLNSTTGVISGTPAAAGNSSVVISATNGNGTGNATFTFQIERGTPGVTTPPVATAIRVGQTLSNSTLSGGAATVPGTFAFTTPSTAPVATGNQSITFTPTDSVNWNTATTNVSVTVNPAPTINVTPGNLTGFSTKQNAASANQTLTVNGTDLEGALTINASTGYEISTNGVSYNQTLTLAPNQPGNIDPPVVIASDNASNYGSNWANGSNGGSGFGNWTISSSLGTGFAGSFIGNPASAGITNMPNPAFGLYANPGGSGATVTVSRAFSRPLLVGESFSFQWATNYDSDSGNKGFNIFAGGAEIVNVNQAGFPGTITCNGQTAIDGYGTEPMRWTFTRTTATNLLVTSTPRTGGNSTAFSTNITISAAPDAFSFYTTAMGAGDERQPYFNNFQITSTGGNLTNSTVYVRLAANGTPGAANGNLTLTSANATTRTVTLSGTVIALAPPIITSRTINGTVGSNLTASINATNSPTSHTATGTLPPGVSFNATTGVFSGTPTNAGNYTLAVTATNADGTGLGNLTFAIGKGTPVITTAPTASLIYAGQALSSSTLSGGMATVNGTATLNGTFAFTNPSLVPPVGNATQSVTFTPADSVNWNTITTNVNVQVSPEPPSPPLVTNSIFNASVGQNLTFTINATNGPTSFANATAMPPGLTLDGTTGAITGTPLSMGNFTTAVTATNIKGTGAGNLTFVIGKGTPAVLTAPTARIYTDETLGTAYSPLSGQMTTIGNFTFVDPSLSFPNSANTTQTVPVLFTPFDLVNWNPTTLNATVFVDALPNYGNLTLTAQVTQLQEGDPFSESRIRIRRPGPLTASATINLSELPAGELEGDISGNLTFLNLPSQVTIPAGSNSTSFYVIAKNDAVFTGNRSVILSVTSRFHGATPQFLTLNITEDEAIPAGFAAWSNNATRTPQRIRDYAIGGAAAPGLTGQAPLFSANSTHTGLSAIVRSVDPKLTVTGEYTTDLATGPWLSANLTLHADQTGLNSAFQRRFFSVPIQPGETRKFLRLRVRLDQ